MFKRLILKKKIFRNDLERSKWLDQLASLMGEGFSLSEGLKIMILYEPNNRKEWMEDIYKDLHGGNGFSSNLPAAGYSNDIVSHILFAEKYGDLQAAIKSSSHILKKRFELIQKSRQMFAYPIFLFVCLILMATILVEGVFPQFQSFFQSMEQELPLITNIVIGILSLFSLPLLLTIFLFILLFIYYVKRKPIQEQVAILIKLPLVRAFIRIHLTHQFVAQLSPMLRNEFSLNHSLNILSIDSRMAFIREEARILLQRLTNGEELSSIIQSRKHFEVQFSAIIKLGESKGSLGRELEQYGKFLFNEQQERIKRLIGISQPLILGSIGFIVIVLFLSMMLPLFNLMNGW